MFICCAVISNLPSRCDTSIFFALISVQSSPLELVTFWGQNAAMATLGAKEPSLDYLCRHSPYTTIVLGYVYKFFDPDDFEGKHLENLPHYCYQ